MEPTKKPQPTRFEQSHNFATLLAVALELQQTLNVIASGRFDKKSEKLVSQAIIELIEDINTPAEA